MTLLQLGLVLVASIWAAMNTPIDQLEADHLRLEAQVERLQEEVSFFRELHQPESSTRLPRPDNGDPEPKS